MGQRGPRPLPKEVKRQRGTFRADRDTSVEVPPATPSEPTWLTDGAREHWRRDCPPLVSAGLITPVDAVAFGLYCQTLHQYCEVLKAIPHVAEYTTEVGEQHSLVQHPLVGVLHKARADVLKLAREFGMTPSARAGLRLGTGEAKEVDPLDAILARRKK